MQTEDIADRLRQFIRSEFGVPADDSEFNDDVDLYNYGYVDSFGGVTLNGFVEREFQIELSEADLINVPLNTIRGISAFVAKRRRGEM
jgi:methoxymalonate biosynthesis acyl carrier protein